MALTIFEIDSRQVSGPGPEIQARGESVASRGRAAGISFAVSAFFGGGILVSLGHAGLSAVLFLAGCIGLGMVLPPTDHDTTGSQGASDST
ncbi:MAG: hypothetical protein ABI742_07675 [Gemmatimonadota bacterium]